MASRLHRLRIYIFRLIFILSIENVFSVFHDCLLIKFKYYYLHVVAMTHHYNMPSIFR